MVHCAVGEQDPKLSDTGIALIDGPVDPLECIFDVAVRVVDLSDLDRGILSVFLYQPIQCLAGLVLIAQRPVRQRTNVQATPQLCILSDDRQGVRGTTLAQCNLRLNPRHVVRRLDVRDSLDCRPSLIEVPRHVVGRRQRVHVGQIQRIQRERSLELRDPFLEIAEPEQDPAEREMRLRGAGIPPNRLAAFPTRASKVPVETEFDEGELEIGFDEIRIEL